MAPPRKIRDNEGYEKFVLHLSEASLIEEIKAIAFTHRVTLREIYLDTRGPTVYAARLEVWYWLFFSLRKSTSEIARIFDRNPSSILYVINKLKACAKNLGVELVSQNGHLVAEAVSRELTEVRVTSGRIGGLKSAGKGDAES